LKRFHFAAAAAIACMLCVLSGSVRTLADAMMDFGSPPSGEVPILYNDHHVYARPDTLRAGRVLAALVKNGTLMVPLRSMFEQMGATVSYDPATKSVTASKPGSQVQVTLGKNEVIINGESRPLDVPPMMYKGVLLVPVRVISEALGAYVQWVPEQHVCVVRYIPPTPVPTPAPTAPPTPVPTPAPTPTPLPLGFVQGAYVSGRSANEYADNVHDSSAYNGEIGLYLGPWAVIGNVRADQYRTSNNAQTLGTGPLTSFATVDGGAATAPVFSARQTAIDGRLEYQIFKPFIYVAGSYLNIWTNYGGPRLTGGGGGLEKLPDPTHDFGWFGYAFYYPNMRGTYMETSGPNNGLSYQQEYQILTYNIGVNYGQRIYVIAGFNGDRYTAKTNAPISQTHAGPYLGLGVRF
jgi:hypothetical protein